MSDHKKIAIILVSIAAQTTLTVVFLAVLNFGNHGFGHQDTIVPADPQQQERPLQRQPEQQRVIAMQVTVGTLGNEPPTDSGLIFARQLNRQFDSVQASKDVERGLLNISYHWSGGQLPPKGQFLIRLFDRNGSYLTHLTSEPIYNMYSLQEFNNFGLESRDLTYQLAMRDLRDADLIEFGWAPF